MNRKPLPQQFKAGNPGKPAGAVNKSFARKAISELLSKKGSWDRFEKELFALKGRAFVENYIRMWEFATPKFSAVNVGLSALSEQDLELVIEHLKERGRTIDIDSNPNE